MPPKCSTMSLPADCDNRTFSQVALRNGLFVCGIQMCPVLLPGFPVVACQPPLQRLALYTVGGPTLHYMQLGNGYGQWCRWPALCPKRTCDSGRHLSREACWQRLVSMCLPHLPQLPATTFSQHNVRQHIRVRTATICQGLGSLANTRQYLLAGGPSWTQKWLKHLQVLESSLHHVLRQCKQHELV